MILAAILLAALVFLLLSPLESLRWWSRSGYDDVATAFREAQPAQPLQPTTAADPTDRPGPTPSAFVVYLSGIGVMDQDTVHPEELAFVADLAARIPGAVPVADVFPYSVENRGLPRRATRTWWHFLDGRRRINEGSWLGNLINLRNLLQLLVSADPRYGPTYNVGTANEILRALRRHGYESDVPVVIVGYSGGAQIAVGSAWYLGMLGIRVSVVSIGGVFTNDPGLDHVEHLWALHGARDRMHRLALLGFPGRWPNAGMNAHGRALRDGRLTTSEIGAMAHSGPDWYFATSRADDDGTPWADITAAAVVTRVRDWLDAPRR